ncbi:MAG: hypothetical protein FJ098_02845 [Deltaproteobacteria bacterium]|nr:hypothetical protein [Deltaproteobacteria bacterium]
MTPAPRLLLAAMIMAGCGGHEDPRPPATPPAEEAAAPSPGDAVRRVLEADEALSERLQRRRPGRTGWVAGQRDYAAAMAMIPLEGTPRRFSEAFRRHQEAWRAFGDFLGARSPWEIEALARGEAPSAPRGPELLRSSRELGREIASTWADVQAEAALLGAGDGPTLQAPPPPVGSTRRLLGR